MTIRNLEYAFQARSVAIIGASPREGSVGLFVTQNVRNAGFKGPIWPVNPKHDTICDLPCFRDIASLPAAPDLAIVATPASTVPGIIAELGERGTRAAMVLTAGLTRESGLRQLMLDAAKPHMLRILGPNSLGMFVPGIGLNASFAHIAPQPGKLAFLSQSGALASAVLDWAVDRKIGFSNVVSLGDMADVDVADMLDLLAGDSGTRAILLYLETVYNTRKFMSAARAAARLKPVIVIKAGRHAAGAKAAATHTGALAGTDGAVDAAFRRAGLLRVIDLEELFEAAETLARFSPIERGRLGIVTNGGGAGVLAIDRLVDYDGETGAARGRRPSPHSTRCCPTTWSKANPVDIIGDAGPERYRAAIEGVFNDDSVDALLVMACPTALASPSGSAQAVADTVRDIDARHPPRFKPILTCWLGEHDAGPARAILREAGVATYDTPSEAVRALNYLTSYSAAQRELMQTPPSAPDVPVDVAKARKIMADVVADGRTTLTEPEAKAALAAFGMPVVETLVAKDVAEVEALTKDLLTRNPAVAVKLLSRDISHKSDVGGVVLGIRTPEAAASAAKGILERVGTKAPDASIEGFTVQAMVSRPGAHELIVGISEDPLFGPIILFGAGGTSVEVVADTAVALPPLDMKLARDLMDQTRISKLLAGYRDRPAADLDAIARALIQVSQMVIDCPEIASLDINPLLADQNGAVVLDARVIVDPERLGESAPNPRLSIRPYPSEWATRLTTSGGSDMLHPADPPGRCAALSGLLREARQPRHPPPAAGTAQAVQPRVPRAPDPDRLCARDGLRRPRPGDRGAPRRVAHRRRSGLHPGGIRGDRAHRPAGPRHRLGAHGATARLCPQRGAFGDRGRGAVGEQRDAAHVPRDGLCRPSRSGGSRLLQGSHQPGTDARVERGGVRPERKCRRAAARRPDCFSRRSGAALGRLLHVAQRRLATAVLLAVMPDAVTTMLVVAIAMAIDADAVAAATATTAAVLPAVVPMAVAAGAADAELHAAEIDAGVAATAAATVMAPVVPRAAVVARRRGRTATAAVAPVVPRAAGLRQVEQAAINLRMRDRAHDGRRSGIAGRHARQQGSPCKYQRRQCAEQ